MDFARGGCFLRQRDDADAERLASQTRVDIGAQPVLGDGAQLSAHVAAILADDTQADTCNRPTIRFIAHGLDEDRIRQSIARLYKKAEVRSNNDNSFSCCRCCLQLKLLSLLLLTSACHRCPHQPVTSRARGLDYAFYS